MYNNIQPNKENPRLKAGCLSQLIFAWIMPLLYKGSKGGLTENDLPKCLPDDESKALGDRLERNWFEELRNAKAANRKPKLRNAVLITFWHLAVADGMVYFIYIMLKSLIPLILAQLLIEMENSNNANSFQSLNITESNATLLNENSTLLEAAVPANSSLPTNFVSDNNDGHSWWWFSWLWFVWHDIYCLGGLLVGSTLIGCFINHHINQRQTRMGVKMRIACCSLIFRKSTKLSLKTAGDISVGYIVNLISNDVNRLDCGFIFVHNLWILPIQTLLVGYLIWLRIGYAAIIGVVALLLQTIPVQVCLTKWTVRLRKRVAQRTDNRISKMNELIRGIPVIKMYAWEKSFEAEVKEARRLEIQETRRSAYLRSFYLSSMILPERLTLFITIVAAVQMGVVITTDMIFSIANLYHVFQMVAGIFCPFAISLGAEAFASFNRIEKFLQLPEKQEALQSGVSQKENAIEIINVTASWNTKGECKLNMDDVAYNSTEKEVELQLMESPRVTLDGINLYIPRGKLCAIVGPVGAGKSSIFHVILNELETSKGSVLMDGEISYASQEAWLFPVSVKNNIIFGQHEDSARYQRVIDSCALMPDFRQLPHADTTLVGEGGASLSGGQKARVNLARAVYKDASIYLFDDPLSAVDARVGRELFNNVIGPRSQLLADKTRILVTHQIQYLREADMIVLVEGGRIVATGNWESMYERISNQAWGGDNDMMLEGEIIDERNHEDEANNDDHHELYNERHQLLQQNGVNPQHALNGKEKKVKKLSISKDDGDDQLEAEDQNKGSVKASVWWEYFHAGNSIMGLLFIALILVISQAICSGADYFVIIYTKIISMGQHQQEATISENVCLIIYSSLIAAAIVMIILRCYLFLKTCMHASKVLHERMFSCVLKATMRFFEIPSGRILNRFSKDMGAMDDSLPKYMSEFTHLALVMLGVLVVICIVNPILLIAVGAVVLVDFGIIKFYLSSSQDLKRLEGIRRSPVFSHVSSCLSGLATIRARGLQNCMMNDFDKLQDLHSAANHLTITSNNALGLWLDCANCCILFNSVTFSFILFNYGTYSGNVGLAITQAMMLTGMVQYGLRQLGESFQQMTSVERILAYTKLQDIEKNDNKDKPNNWPSRGEIEFRNVTYQYKDEGKNVLNNLNFTIEPSWKVGIVGRTGAGKTSLISALFRLYDPKGKIVIDDKDCACIDLHTLRSSISVIPQEPVLFKGTIRYNLDPFDTYKLKQQKLLDALKNVGLSDAVALNSEVAESGSNLSIGERQLICLARAILRENKILVLDEATANVDENTDSKIQQAIRTHFQSCTVLTIAHRLRTVMDSDRILVLGEGNLLEFGIPHKLLQNPNGHLKQMVDATNEGARELYDKAKEAYENVSSA